ncbi:HAD-superfamily hydrolase, subfamily IIB [Anaeromyces robustus]|uniref:HAD-superfamily hydrolase, subfamily IIB n=1 Tax=Anaeromyces robustus TaxID=1754192 RepID=A0A1Y1XJB5_9FUNG|nr:HAD-superfamily hydrolase, subfamily IIB [Anaeromyces robustus]|eukprot:ORX85841.1 HAD-superfamily hydrolase, subfamily IIB [Anaeromyces robustus]
MVKRRYLFFDIDGTLAAGGYGNTYIPESTKKALKKLKEAGHFLCIATGRSQAMAVSFMEELGFENMVSDGGYGVTIDGKLIDITPLSKEKIIALIDECEEKNIPWGIQIDNSDTRLVKDERFENITHDIYMKSRIVPDLDPRNYDKIYKAYIVCPYPVENSIKSLSELPWCRFFKEYLYVEPSDKAFGINKVLKYFGAKPEDALVFGDAMNDISMFTDDGWIRVAMGNAIPELKEKADFVTTDVDKDGIYNACEKFGLFEPVTEN